MATNITLPSDGGSRTIQYKLNCNVSTVTFSNSAPSWLTVTSDVNNRTFTISCGSNTSFSERSATLIPTINGNNCSSKTIAVTQNARSCDCSQFTIVGEDGQPITYGDYTTPLEVSRDGEYRMIGYLTHGDCLKGEPSIYETYNIDEDNVYLDSVGGSDEFEINVDFPGGNAGVMGFVIFEKYRTDDLGTCRASFYFKYV